MQESVLDLIDPILQGQLFKNARLKDCCVAQCSSTLLLRILQNVLFTKSDLTSSDFGGLPSPDCAEGFKYAAKHCPNIKKIFLKFTKYAWLPGATRSLNNVFQNCKMISSISLIYVNGLDNYTMQVIGQNCQNLETFVVGNNKHQEHVIDVTDRGLKTVFEGCLKLQNVGLLLLGFITDKSLLSLAQNSAQNLIEFSVHNCPRLTQTGFCYLFQRCTNLKKIGLVPSTSENKNQLGFQSMFDLAANSTSLEEVYISEELTNVGIIDDTCLVPLALNVPKLTKLVLSDLAVDDGALYIFAKNCPHLKCIWLDSCSMGDPGVIALARNCENLQELHLGAVQPHGRYSLLRIQEPQTSGITDESIKVISYECQKLKHFSLSGQELITCLSLYFLLSNKKLLAQLETLRLEHLTGLSGMRCQDDILIAMLSHCTNLRVISLEGYQGNTAVILQEILPIIGHKIQKIDLRCCHAHSEETCIAIADYCPNTSSLKFGYSKGLTADGLNYLIKKRGSRIKDLDLYGVSCVNDEVINCILQNCIDIKALNVGSRSPSYANKISISVQSQLYQLQNIRRDVKINLECLQDIDARASYRHHFQEWYS